VTVGRTPNLPTDRPTLPTLCYRRIRFCYIGQNSTESTLDNKSTPYPDSNQGNTRKWTLNQNTRGHTAGPFTWPVSNTCIVWGAAFRSVTGKSGSMTITKKTADYKENILKFQKVLRNFCFGIFHTFNLELSLHDKRIDCYSLKYNQPRLTKRHSAIFSNLKPSIFTANQKLRFQNAARNVIPGSRYCLKLVARAYLTAITDFVLPDLVQGNTARKTRSKGVSVAFLSLDAWLWQSLWWKSRITSSDEVLAN